MIGLRTFLKDFATSTKLAPFDTLYERQRELVRCDLLPQLRGRGPGSGVPLSAETLATFLISVLASDKLADLGERTAMLCQARGVINKGDQWRIGHSKSTFQIDVARALLQERNVGKRSPKNIYLGIQVTRPWRGTILQARPTATQGQLTIEYFTDPNAPLDLQFTMQNVSIEGPVFSWLSNRLWDYMEHFYNLKPERG
jgi:hypothetical protein